MDVLPLPPVPLGEESLVAFSSAKDALASTGQLALQTDTSDMGLGAVAELLVNGH